ncbi:hypothetical protein FQN57_000517 [Myotisia sp. PD_48]|nr:hypothetical protein FQN57_000517 [Myotisia sp. PD_48]
MATLSFETPPPPDAQPFTAEFLPLTKLFDDSLIYTVPMEDLIWENYKNTNGPLKRVGIVETTGEPTPHIDWILFTALYKKVQHKLGQEQLKTVQDLTSIRKRYFKLYGHFFVIQNQSEDADAALVTATQKMQDVQLHPAGASGFPRADAQSIKESWMEARGDSERLKLDVSKFTGDLVRYAVLFARMKKVGSVYMRQFREIAAGLDSPHQNESNSASIRTTMSPPSNAGATSIQPSIPLPANPGAMDTRTTMPPPSNLGATNIQPSIPLRAYPGAMSVQTTLPLSNLGATSIQPSTPLSANPGAMSAQTTLPLSNPEPTRIQRMMPLSVQTTVASPKPEPTSIQPIAFPPSYFTLNLNEVGTSNNPIEVPASPSPSRPPVSRTSPLRDPVTLPFKPFSFTPGPADDWADIIDWNNVLRLSPSPSSSSTGQKRCRDDLESSHSVAKRLHTGGKR